MRAQEGIATGPRYIDDRGDHRYQAPVKPTPVGLAPSQHTASGASFSVLASFAPWVVAAAAVIVLARIDERPVQRLSPEPTRVSSASDDIADRLADQQERITRLASKLDGLSEKITAAATSKSTPPVSPVNAPTMKRKIEHRPDPEAPARAAVAQDLDKLRQYVKEVADSLAVIDTQINDPAALQRKLERQKALIRQPTQ